MLNLFINRIEKGQGVCLGIKWVCLCMCRECVKCVYDGCVEFEGVASQINFSNPKLLRVIEMNWVSFWVSNSVIICPNTLLTQLTLNFGDYYD